MFKKIKARAAAVKSIAALLTQAEEIARNGGAEQPAAEHLVLAALQLPDGTAARALERLGCAATDFATVLEEQEVDDLGRIGVHADHDRIGAELPVPGEPSGLYRSETSAQELFKVAGDEARHGGGAFVGAHVLRAAAGLEHGATARALRRMGIDRAELRDAATSEIDARKTA